MLKQCVVSISKIDSISISLNFPAPNLDRKRFNGEINFQAIHEKNA
jgi:hypothetical protein